MLASIDSLAWSALAERAARASTAAQVRKLLREFQESF
jgi:hypothetical protein